MYRRRTAIAAFLVVVSSVQPCWGMTDKSPMARLLRLPAYDILPSGLLWQATDPTADDKGAGRKTFDYSARLIVYPPLVVTEATVILGAGAALAAVFWVAPIPRPSKTYDAIEKLRRELRK